jgi:H+/Cl- antiporter ClcA
MSEEDQKTIVFAVLGFLAVAFAAVCVWLAVRIVNRRERWAKRLAVVLAVATVVGYPLSVGPVAFLSRHSNGLPEGIYAAYAPLHWVHDISPRPIQKAMTWNTDDLWK